MKSLEILYQVCYFLNESKRGEYVGITAVQGYQLGIERHMKILRRPPTISRTNELSRKIRLGFGLAAKSLRNLGILIQLASLIVIFLQRGHSKWTEKWERMEINQTHLDQKAIHKWTTNLFQVSYLLFLSRLPHYYSQCFTS